MFVELFNHYPVIFLASAFCLISSAVVIYGFFKSDTFVVLGASALIACSTVLGVAFWYPAVKAQSVLSEYAESILDVSGLPAQIEDGLTLDDIKWDGARLSNVYSVASEGLLPDEAFVVSASCRGAQRVSFLALGGTIEHKYLMNGTTARRFKISAEDCFK